MFRRVRTRYRPGSALWSNANFLNLWASESISQFGSQISLLAIPLIAAITLDASPFAMGLLGAAGGVPRFVLGFLIGPWVDRNNKRRVMLTTDIARALCLLAIPVAWWLNALSIPLLILVAALIGILSVFFSTAYSAIVPQIVERRQLGDAHGKLWMSVSAAQTAGPAMAGGLTALMSAPLVTLVNAVTYCWSAWYIRGIRITETVHVETAQHHWRKEILDGFRILFASAVLTSTTLTSVMISLTGNMFLAVYVLYMTDDLGLSGSGVGLVFAAGGTGGLIGAAASGWFARRFGVGNTIVWGSIAFGVFGATVPAAMLIPDYALPLIVFAECFQWLTLTMHDVNRVALRQALTPDRLQGRISASTQTLYGGAQTLGLLLGGLTGEWIGIGETLVIGVIGMFLASLIVIASPTRSYREMPEEPDALFASF